MFNLIVSGSLESGGIGTISTSRVFEYTLPEIETQFRIDRKLNVQQLISIPAIFMEEGIQGQLVGIGWLSRIDLRGKDYQLRYHLDHEIPKMTNADVFALASQLQIEEWEFHRNHWAIKDIDLFQTLYKEKVGRRPVPTVFKLSENSTRPNFVSMMMPFSGDFHQVYQTVKSTVESAGYECQRADDFWLHAHIIQDVIELICTSTVVVCDLSGKNTNVFYEAGIAHTIGKNVILITQNIDDVPFDLRALRCITYLNNQEGREKLGKDIVARLRTIA